MRAGGPVLCLLAVASCTDRRNQRESPPVAKQEVPAPRPKAKAPDLPPHTVHATIAEALEAILKTKPRVLGFGEFHAIEGAAPVASPLQRFTGDMLGVLGPHLSDLVIETWVSEGKCGKAEAKVTRDVPRETERPPETENELMRLAKRARELGVQPLAMKLSCKDYEALLAKEGNVDYETMLGLITRELLRVASEAVSERDQKPESRPIVAVYGGAIHNDLDPYESTKQWSYASRLREQVPGYVEVDLYVPELVEGNELLEKEAWYPLLAKAKPHEVTLIRRAPRSFILLLQRGVAAQPTKGQPGSALEAGH